AIEWFEKAAEQGFAMAQYSLGVMYSQGQGVTQDDQQAVNWFAKAAAQGNAKAQYNLGVMYRQGQGVTQDYQ
ncbi:sel1 repeat family protein, partial [Aeromonas allosaccharophila]|nr:sel1 repeat family protein [Aeromonas allosaccharophila]